MCPNFKVISGGIDDKEKASISPDPKPYIKPDMTAGQRQQKIVSLMYFLKGLEAQLASIETQAKTLGLKNLSDEVSGTYSHIVKCLRIIKQAHKQFKGTSQNVPEKKEAEKKKNPFSIVKD